MDLKITAVASGVVEGETRNARERRSSKYFLEGRRSPKDVRTRGTVIPSYTSVPPNRLAKKCKVYRKS